MDCRNSFVCALGMALVLGFAGVASAQESEGVNDETPYIDADGNFDADMAKDYAELVDSYVDDFGTAWDVWLDEFGGQMWAETSESSVVGAEEAVSASSGATPLLVIHWFSPDYVKLYHHTTLLKEYTVAGTDDGYIAYSDSTCPDSEANCSEWKVWDRGGEQPNVTKIEGRGRSTADYCDGYFIGHYGNPGDDFWIQPDSDTCGGAGPYYYSVTDDDIAHGQYSSTESPAHNDWMLKYEYRIGSTTYRAEVTWGGCDPI